MEPSKSGRTEASIPVPVSSGGRLDSVEWNGGMDYWNAPPTLALFKMHQYLDPA